MVVIVLRLLDFQCCVKNARFVIHSVPTVQTFIFINSLLIELENLGIRSKIYQMLSTPVRYMDEFASCCLPKQRIHYAMEIMQDYRSTWR